MKKTVLLAFIFLLIPAALASTMSLEPVKDSISPFGTAEFILKLNNTNADDKFILSYGDLTGP